MGMGIRVGFLDERTLSILFREPEGIWVYNRGLP
jgi:hypothetical protein